jgi:radical SAM superfamily enzyme YgiQ (UPF0313 family)
MALYEEFIQANLHRLRDAPLYRQNPTFGNPPWADGGPRVLILRLSPFRDVERSSPHLFLAAAVRSAAPGAYIDMAFLPPRQDRLLMQAQEIPLVLGTQSHRSLSDFSVVLASNSCIPELVNLPILLEGSGVPLWAGARGPEWPLVILGGSSSAAAHPIVRPDGDFMADGIFFGEGEGAVEKIISLWGGDEGKGRRIRRLAAAVPGLWPAGDLSLPVRRSLAPDGHIASLRWPRLPGEEAGTARLAITRGCPCLCSFCFEAFDRRPFRQLPADGLLSAARELKAASGAETLEIESFNFNTHEGIATLLLGLHRMFLRVNAMSQRADILAAEPGLLACEIASGKRTFTLGVEGVSQGQRRFLHKSLETPDIRAVLEALHRGRVREIKLFFVLTGRERTADLEELALLAGWLKELRGGTGPRLIFSFGLLVRMPFTPLRHDRLYLEEKHWKPLIGKAKSICETNGFEFRLSSSWSDYRLIQVLAAGGYELAALMEALARAGCTYDGEFPPEAGQVLDAWLASNPASSAALLVEKPADYPFPFGFLESAEERASLHRRWQDASAERDGGYCRRGSPDGGCADCPGCRLAPPRVKRGAAPDPNLSRKRELAEAVAAKARLKPFFAKAWIPVDAAGAERQWRDAWLLSRFLELHPDQAGNVLSVREALVSPWAGRAAGPLVPWFGHALAAVIAWEKEEILDRLERVPVEGDLPWSFHSPLSSLPQGPWRSLSIRLTLPGSSASKAVQRISSALEAQHTPVTIRREGAWYAIHVGEKSLRRRGIRSGRYPSGLVAAGRPAGDPLSIDLCFGPAFDLGAFLAHLDPDPAVASAAVMEVSGFEL